MPRHRQLASLATAALGAGVLAFLLLTRGPVAITPEAPGSASAAPSAPEPPEAPSGPAARALPPGDGFENAPEFEEGPETHEPAPDPTLPVLAVGPATLALARRYAELEKRVGWPASTEVNGRDRRGEPTFDIELTPAARAGLEQRKAAAVAVLEARTREVVAAGLGGASSSGLTALYRAPFVEAGVLGADGDSLNADAPMMSVWARGWLGGKVIGADVAFRMTGGSDGALAIFETGAPRLSMVFAIHNFASISSGCLNLGHAVRALPEGGYHVMTVCSSPWISSSWRGARLRIHTPGSDPWRPRLLLDEANSARAWEVAADLKALDDGFSAVFSSWAHMAQGDPTRPHFRHFRWEGGTYRRVGPYTARERDLLDEWLQLPWDEAQRLTDPAAVARLAPVHARLQPLNEALTLRGTLQLKRDRERRVFRLVPENSEAPAVTFTVEGEGERVRITDVAEVDRPATEEAR